MSEQSYGAQYAAIIAKTWIDPEFRQRLIEYPEQVLTEHGIRFPEGVKVKVDPNASSGHVTLGLPPRPGGISDEDIHTHFVAMPGCF